MNTEMGEYLVGAYLKVVEGCEFVDYNVHFPGGGLKGLDELDVIGFNFESSVAFLCEVITHIRGILYKDNETTVRRIAAKFEKQKRYAGERLRHLAEHRFMLWSPIVPKGYLTENLVRIEGLELIINEEYARRIDQLRQHARTSTHDVGNPAFRLLQILEHMRG
jgi:hypothetical protein